MSFWHSFTVLSAFGSYDARHDEQRANAAGYKFNTFGAGSERSERKGEGNDVDVEILPENAGGTVYLVHGTPVSCRGLKSLVRMRRRQRGGDDSVRR